jgi:DnaB-like helicase C terminal domain
MSGAFGLGFKCLKSLCATQHSMKWYRAKLIAEMFRPGEVEAFKWVDDFVLKHHALPQVATLEQAFPEIASIDAPEPASYYLEKVETRLYYERINKANIDSQAILKGDQNKIEEAVTLLGDTLSFIRAHQYRHRIVDLVKEGPLMALNAYHDVMMMDNVGQFGWAYLDKSTGGMMPGDVISFVGRPAAGKTWKVLYTAMHNWQKKGKRVLVVSMEMAPLPLVQRLVAMYAHTNISQLKVGGYSTHTYKKFEKSLAGLANETDGFYIVDGNLAASVEDIYALAQQLKCDQVYIDGAYLLRHKNIRLDRYTRVAENIEMIKRSTSDCEIPTVASYQFSRTATKNKKKGEVGDLDDIGYSDAIGQISTIALGLFQDDSVETLEGRVVRVLKGRNGEIGQFKINWDFQTMDFSEIEETVTEKQAQLEYI